MERDPSPGTRQDARCGGAAYLTAGANHDQMVTAGGVGVTLGFVLGWKAFYQNIVIPLE